MKRIIYLLVLLLCFAGCKKEEVSGRVKVAKVSFSNDTKPVVSLDIRYNGEIYAVPGYIPMTYGNRTFEVLDRSGEKIAEGTFNISGNIHYYIYQAEATAQFAITTEPPPLPPGPTDPLENATPAPEGFMKIKISHDLAPLGFGEIDVQLLSNFNSDTNYEVYTTIQNVTTTLSSEFVMIKRPERNGALLQNFKFRFINSITKAPAMSGNGQPYTTYNASLGRSVYNVYLLGFSFFESGDPNDFEHNGAFYEIDADVISK